MSDWDSDVEESDDVKPKETKPTQPAPKVAVQDAWELSESSEDEESKQLPKQMAALSTDAALADSEASDDDAAQNATIKDAPATERIEPEEVDPKDLERIKKKLQNYKLKKKKKRNKKKKKQSKNNQEQQNKVPPNQDELIVMSSSDSSDDENAKNKKKMETYDERMRTDNDILFEGHKVAKKQQPAPPKPDTRPMLSGEVTLKNFPLGSARDCENLADQATGILSGALFRQEITSDDVFAFFKQIITSKLADKLDMYATQELSNKINQLHAANHKAYQKKKNPKGKKKKAPQYLVDKHRSGGRNAHYVDGQFNGDEYGDLFD